MASEKYVVASEQGATWAGAELGSEVSLDLTKEQRTALIAAGWLDEVKKGGKK